jgi:hypothetical protein
MGATGCIRPLLKPPCRAHGALLHKRYFEESSGGSQSATCGCSIPHA